MAVLQLREGVGHAVQGIGRGDHDLDGAVPDQFGHLAEDFTGGGVRAALGLGSELLCLLEGDDRLDAVAWNAERFLGQPQQNPTTSVLLPAISGLL